MSLTQKEKIGVYHANDYGVREENYKGDNTEEEFFARLPNGNTMGNCTDQQMIFDIHNMKDFENIKYIYGEPSKWSYYNSDTKSFSDLKVIHLGRPLELQNQGPTF